MGNNVEVPKDESKLTPYQLLNLRKSQLKAATQEADTRISECDAEQRRVLAAFKVERTNQVGKLNKAKTDRLTKVSGQATALIDKAQAEAHKIVDAATVNANNLVKVEREACSREFGAKSLELATAYERDHGVLTAKQAAERSKIVQAWAKANADLVAQVEKLEAQVAEETAQAEKRAAEAAALKADAAVAAA